VLAVRAALAAFFWLPVAKTSALALFYRSESGRRAALRRFAGLDFGIVSECYVLPLSRIGRCASDSSDWSIMLVSRTPETGGRSEPMMIRSFSASLLLTVAHLTLHTQNVLSRRSQIFVALLHYPLLSTRGRGLVS
jgi:hypothetical protein